MFESTRGEVEGESMARTPTGDAFVQVSIRLPAAWSKVADEIATKLSRPGLEVARSDAYRVALLRGFEELRRELGLPPVDAAPPAAAPSKRTTKTKTPKR